jgi:hypothetical protein
MTVEVQPWPKLISDRVSTDGRAKIRAVAWIRDPTRKSDYKEKGVQTVIGDLARTDG